jgi:guanine nucleotide-binding protein subunit alpha
MFSLAFSPTQIYHFPQIFAEHIIEYMVDSTPNFVFSTYIAQAIHGLWQHPIIPKVMDCLSQFYLLDSAG